MPTTVPELSTSGEPVASGARRTLVCTMSCMHVAVALLDALAQPADEPDPDGRRARAVGHR